MSKSYVDVRYPAIAWVIFLGVMFLLLVGTILAPLAKFLNIKGLAHFLYGFYGLTCHQIPSRSLFLFGEKMGVCTRCFATYLSLIPAGALLFIIRLRSWISQRSFLKFVLPVSLSLNLPMIADGLIQLLTPWESTNILRLITGGLSGIGMALFLGWIFLKVTREE
ncbi:DUF2085 domain-containing protein [candidate division WOR-3 bacterium]|uniref:DUF2085 domain-containing protein n=1 Tax=candidate division WOR-3 bacterium TaxID=2052148 RepID=A0A9D5K884_UNCW3|nr:DUF2085 domain-containing protein [candidate division WOR-3 bacterium]MBD3364233.1 DUF2085 domain-containing protein [candidate division WOR-3 bacterium]